VLAYSTVSQLGYMFLGVGVGAYAAGIFHLMTHAFFKALLFLGSGAVIHAMHEAYHATHSHEDAQDMRNMGGLRKFMPITFATMWIATLAIAGIWPFAGFFSKDEIIWSVGAMAGAEHAPYPGLYTVLWVISLAAAMLTAFYMTRLMIMTFHGKNRTGSEEARHLHEVGPVMWIPLAILAVLSVFGGWINVPEEIRTSFLGGMGALPMTEWLHHWLEPVTASAHHVMEEHVGEISHYAPFGGGEVAWALISTLLALAIVVVTSQVLGRKKFLTASEEGAPKAGIRKVLYNKWYVDELYDAVVVQPLLRASRWLWRIFDSIVIDGTINALANLQRAFGWLGSLFQTGQINTYAFILVVGLLLVLRAMIF
jgi:NADH-quinone oxidoreductase subunit L